MECVGGEGGGIRRRERGRQEQEQCGLAKTGDRDVAWFRNGRKGSALCTFVLLRLKGLQAVPMPHWRQLSAPHQGHSDSETHRWYQHQLPTHHAAPTISSHMARSPCVRCSRPLVPGVRT